MAVVDEVCLESGYDSLISVDGYLHEVAALKLDERELWKPYLRQRRATLELDSNRLFTVTDRIASDGDDLADQGSKF